MEAEDLKRLKELLMRQRREIFERLQGLKSYREDLSERDIEMEEEAQKADISSLLNQLDELESQEIKEIGRALAKMAAVSYGICEKCRMAIPLKRLETLPATRFCKKCAQKVEMGHRGSNA